MKFPALLIAALALCGCAKKAENSEAIREAIVQHVAKTMSMDQMSVQVSSVSFHGNTADAVATFTPKGMPNSAVTFNYDLERNGSGWVVKGRGRMNAAHGKEAPGTVPHANGMGDAVDPNAPLPPGHPAVGNPAPPPSRQQ